MTFPEFRKVLRGAYVLAIRKSDRAIGTVKPKHLYRSICQHSSNVSSTIEAMTDSNLYGAGFEDEYFRYYLVDPTKPNIVDMMVEAQQYKEAGL
jgi:hypothetical protein